MKRFYQIKSFIILAVLRESVYRVCWAHLRVIAPGQHSSFQRNVAAVRAVGHTVSDLTGPRFEPQTSRSRDERVNADFIFQRIVAFVLSMTTAHELVCG